jgi:hypothetical protein
MRKAIVLCLFLMSCGQDGSSPSQDTPQPGIVEVVPVTPEGPGYGYLIEIADQLEKRKQEIIDALINPEKLPPWFEDDIGWRCLAVKIIPGTPKKLEYLFRVEPEEINERCQGRVAVPLESL